MGTRKNKTSDTIGVGAVGELMFAAEARSRGCQVFFPVGEATALVDMVVVTPSGRKLTVQIKAQSTRKFSTVDLRVGHGEYRKATAGHADILVVFNDGWHLFPTRLLLPDQKTLNVNVIREYRDNWKCLK